MTRDEAAELLGVDPGASASELRRAYRSRLRQVHPDRGGTAAATEAVLAAYGCLLDEAAADLAPSVTDDTSAAQQKRTEQHDAAIEVTGAHEEVFMALLEALEGFAVVTYVDAEAGLLEALIGSVHKLTVTLQGRANHVEVFFTLESPGRLGAPVLEDLARTLTEDLN